MIFAPVTHEARPNLRIMLVGDDANPPNLKHFYLQRRKGAGKPWETSRKLEAERLDKYVEKYKFDKMELIFALEEAAEKAAEREGGPF